MLEKKPPQRVAGTAVFLTATPDLAPPALLHSLKHYKVLHEHNVILTIISASQPRIQDSERVVIEHLGDSFMRVSMSFGYIEEPNVPRVLGLCRRMGWKFDIMSTSFFLSRRTLRASRHGGMPLWQDNLFILLAHNATDASSYFQIPTGRVVEIGMQVTV
jgi:KUP system potassium uptake protein